MLSAYFDIKAFKPAAAQPEAREHRPFGKGKGGRAKAGRPAKRAPQPTEAATTSVHAKFEPLPAEKNVPRAAELPGQPWQALSGTDAKDDDFVEFKPDEDGMWDEEERGEEDADDMSEPDFEPDSLDPIAVAGTSVGGESYSSLDDAPIAAFFRRRRSQSFGQQPVPVYSGPQLCCEDDDFD